MENAFNVMFNIFQETFGYSMLWALGTLAFRSVVRALSGQDVTLR